MELGDIIEILLLALLSFLGIFLSKYFGKKKPKAEGDTVKFTYPFFYKIFFVFALLFFTIGTIGSIYSNEDWWVAAIFISLAILGTAVFMTFINHYWVLSKDLQVHYNSFTSRKAFNLDQIQKISFDSFRGNLAIHLPTGEKVYFSPLFTGKNYFYQLLLNKYALLATPKAKKLMEQTLEGKRIDSIF